MYATVNVLKCTCVPYLLPRSDIQGLFRMLLRLDLTVPYGARMIRFEHAHVFMVYVCVCVCVCQADRSIVHETIGVCVCVCVCVYCTYGQSTREPFRYFGGL